MRDLVVEIVALTRGLCASWAIDPSSPFPFLSTPLSEEETGDFEECIGRLKALEGDLSSRLRQEIVSRLTPKDLKSLLQSWIVFVMDLTFLFENRLFEEDRPHGDCVKLLLASLQIPTSLALKFAQSFPSEDSDPEISVYGTELAETLRWRRGAINYMFASTTFTADPDADVTESLKQGIEDLKAMLTTRKIFRYPVSSKSAASEELQVQTLAESQKGADLLYNRGVLSSSHLLGLIYIAELHYWLWLHGRIGEEEKAEARELGMQLVQSYLDAVSLVPVGTWDSSRAIEIMQHFRST